jgi:acyl-CoA thioesterase-1
MAITASPLPRLCRRLAFLALLAASCLTALVADASARQLQLVVIGDSLSAGYELPSGASFPEQLQARLRQRGLDVAVLDASVSGDTSAAGLARLDWALPEPVDGVLIELGANDALRGIDPAETYGNLEQMVKRLQQRGVAVLLAGMKAPRNLDNRYAVAFDAIYPRLAAQYRLPLYPFFLDGVLFEPSLLLADGMHPNEKGVATIVERIMPATVQWLATLAPAAAARQ